MSRLARVRVAVASGVLAVAGVMLIVAEEAVHSAVAVVLVTTAVFLGADSQRARERRTKWLTSEVREARRTLNRIDSGTAEAKTRQQRIEVASEQSRRAAEALAVTTVQERKRGTRPRVMFVTSNGSGMGHLTRLIAVARAGEGIFESTFVSLSSAASVAASLGYEVTQVESQSNSGLGWPEWNRRFSAVLAELLREHEPDAVVFDGIHVFRGLTERVQEAGVPLVWMCRGLWKESVSRHQVRAWRDVVDVMIHPSEGALVASVQSRPDPDLGGWTVAPIVLTDPSEYLSRDDAIDALGLDPSRRYVRVQLGAGIRGGRPDWEAAAVAAVRQLGAMWSVVIVRSPLAVPGEDLEGAMVIQRYPIAPYIAAFDFSITAAGYNTVHECIAALQPAVYVPDDDMLADDQRRRADAIAAHGGGLVVDKVSDLASSVLELAHSDRRDASIAALRAMQTESGAASAAQVVAEAASVARGRHGLAIHRFLPRPQREQE